MCSHDRTYFIIENLILSQPSVEVNRYKKSNFTSPSMPPLFDNSTLLISIKIKNSSDSINSIKCSSYKSINKLNRVLQIDNLNNEYFEYPYVMDCQTCSSYAIEDTLFPLESKPFYLWFYNFPDSCCGDWVYLENTLTYSGGRESNFIIFLDMKNNKINFLNKTIDLVIEDYKKNNYKVKFIEESIRD